MNTGLPSLFCSTPSSMVSSVPLRQSPTFNNSLQLCWRLIWRWGCPKIPREVDILHFFFKVWTFEVQLNYSSCDIAFFDNVRCSFRSDQKSAAFSYGFSSLTQPNLEWKSSRVTRPLRRARSSDKAHVHLSIMIAADKILTDFGLRL